MTGRILTLILIFIGNFYWYSIILPFRIKLILHHLHLKFHESNNFLLWFWNIPKIIHVGCWWEIDWWAWSQIDVFYVSNAHLYFIFHHGNILSGKFYNSSFYDSTLASVIFLNHQKSWFNQSHYFTTLSTSCNTQFMEVLNLCAEYF